MLAKALLLLALVFLLASADAKAASEPPKIQNAIGTIKGVVTDRNNVAPFVSFALGITSSEKLILRGGASIDYAPPTLLPYGELKGTPLYPVAAGFARADQIAGVPLPTEWAERRGAVEIEPRFSAL